MCWHFKLCRAATTLLSLFVGSKQTEAGTTEALIPVRVYNYVHVSEADLLQATGVVQRILQEAGVRAVWQDCSVPTGPLRTANDCESKRMRGGLVINLVKHLERIFPGVESTALGFSVSPQTGEPATIAYIDCPRTRTLASSTAFAFPELLGFAVAHEIGHLLLGDRVHSQTGIMKARWRTRDLERGYREEFFFTPGQGYRLRAAAKSRWQIETEGVTEASGEGLGQKEREETVTLPPEQIVPSSAS